MEMDKLERFVIAQNPIYQIVLQELKAGQKCTHWMWFIFPQFAHLGRSHNAKYYGIDDLSHAKAYVSHDVLGVRLRECCQILLDLSCNDGVAIFGVIDNQKLQSSMTLFDTVCPDDIFSKVLQKYFGGERDKMSLI